EAHALATYHRCDKKQNPLGNMSQTAVSTAPSTITPMTTDSRFEYLDILPENTIHQFKAILVHYIRKRLPKGYRQLGKQTVSISATESQFYAVFKNHIHYYSATKGIYKCIFRGGSSNQVLSNILEMQGWEIKFYDQRQCTYVVLCDGDNNIENGEENPIAAALSHETIKKL
ncbi:8836_t:CDS:2, partial [Rhizophagus irregularis]